MTPTTNHELLQEYITREHAMIITYVELIGMLKEIQSKLIEPMEYEIWDLYEFSNDGKEWNKQKFVWYHSQDSYMLHCRWNHIRPLTILPEITSAISLLEATGEYVISKI